MKYFSVLIASLLLSSFVADKPAYQLYNSKGEPIAYDKMLAQAKEADVIFFGELHNNPICHWLQIELTKDLHKEFGENVVLGAEMFEADDQLIINEYLSGVIKEKNFIEEAKLWKNYTTDYKPLIEFAKENKLAFIATNIPRRYAAVVHKHGFEGIEKLQEDAKRYIAPTPIDYDPELGCYKNMMQMMGEMGGHKPNPNFPKAQASKDATMAWFIKENFKNGQKFIHLNGTYHSDKHEGILWYLKKYAPELKVLTIASVEQDKIDTLEEENKENGDFILAIPSSMTKTY